MKLKQININYRLYVIVVGCGRVGLEVATRLSEIGFDMTIVEKSPDALSALPENYGGFTIIGDATERDVLKRAKAEKADLLITTTGDDPTNYFVGLIGSKIFGITNVISLVRSKENVTLFENSGIRVISPINLAIETFQRSILEGVEPAAGDDK
ncbi:MAG TPA: TrkA family potassium uptake protein [Fervidobacterium sp.]|nr:TrkA family potassium uptake protein [Fervidobacterium sp.]HON03777.1 TrkA family potassium uptake protein [Fervidobacterium sp.]HPC78712.1 TrkA family potassium uptake protein [Fervidobacterium sp.]HRB91366.1 TrkA family potassium uptake protein [Fervidobacterium sp.]HRT00854.1 TrkA family potassium uptake protein [Fervidobacterium sp.]